MIPTSELTELQSASTVLDVSESAVDTHIEQSLAYTINSAANCGQTAVLWQHGLSDDYQEHLISLGYSIRPLINAANPNYPWIIQWK